MQTSYDQVIATLRECAAELQDVEEINVLDLEAATPEEYSYNLEC